MAWCCLLSLGTRASADLTVKRSLKNNSAKYTLRDNYRIQIVMKPGDKVTVLEDSDLMTGNSVVGHVKKGETYLIARTQDPWANLKTLDGTAMNGWIQMSQLTLASK